MKFRVLLILVVWVGALRAQGLVFNDAAYSNTAVSSQDVLGSKDGGFAKDVFKIDLKPYCPTVRAQGKVSSCVGWSVGYAAMTIEKAILNEWGGDQRTIDDNAYSAMFLYNQIKLGDCYFGAELNQAFETLKKQGNVFYRDFAVGNNCDSLPTEKLVQKARINRVSDFSALFLPDEKEDVKIERVKHTLIRRKPVVIGMVVLENFLSLKSSDEVWYPNVGKTDLFGGHAMVVIGFDESRKAFEIMNSWGEGWANHGFVWVRYHDFAKYCKYAYELQLKDEASSDLEGRIRALRPLVKLVSGGAVDVSTSPLSFVALDAKYRYTIDKSEIPFEFQLIAEDLKKGSYLHVVSFDEHLKPMVHWPRDEELGPQFKGEHASPLINAAHITNTLPGKFNVFRLSQAATEYICILNSRNPIRNLSERLKQVGRMKGDLTARIAQVFNAKAVKLSHNADGQTITFLEDDPKTGAVFVLLEFSVGGGK